MPTFPGLAFSPGLHPGRSLLLQAGAKRRGIRGEPYRRKTPVMAAICLVVTLLASIYPVIPAAAAEPHENPDTTPVVYDAVAFFQKYGQAVALIPSGDTAGLEFLRRQSEFANVPPELRNTLNHFLNSCIVISAILPDLQGELQHANATIAQYRIADARPTLATAKDKLNQAYSGLLTLDESVADTGRYWKVDSLKVNDSLNITYYDVRSQLVSLRSLLDKLNDMYSSLVTAVPVSGLRSSNLSLVVNPDTAFVGETVYLRGVLTSDGIPLGGRLVDLLIDNVPVRSVLTGSDGVYQSSLNIPFKYTSRMNLQAVFNPAGIDAGQYLGASSLLAGLNVLFYSAELRASQGTPANPGRSFLTTAVFSYNGSPAPESRNLIVNLDNNPVLDVMVSPSAVLVLPVAANTSLGTHELSFYAPPSGRYAPAAYNMEVEVSLVAPVIDVKTSRLLFLPFSREINGKIYSSLGPLKNADVVITIGGWKASAVTNEDGSFSAMMDTGLSLNLLGRQNMRIAVTPVEPWYKSGFLDIPVIVTNPVSIAGILLILIFPFWWLAAGRKRVRTPPPRLEPRPAAPPAAPVNIIAGNAGSAIITLYKGILALVQAAAGLVLQPYQTLSEFATEAGPKLGRLAMYFQEFTRIIERHLYSRHTPAGTDTERAKELGRTLMSGIKHENP